jgi:hypothetical protein
MLFGFSVINEVSTATQLMATGLNQIVDPDWISAEPASAFTCLASGVERVMKLTYGLDTLNSGALFPNSKDLQRLGHDLMTLDGIVFPRLLASANSSNNDYVLRLLRDVNADPYWPAILATLNAWAAASGRYRDLDVLAGKTAGDPPHALWDEVELRCTQDLGLLRALFEPEHGGALVRIRTRLAESVLKWWFAVYRAWMHGLIGSDQKSPGTLLSPANTRQLAKALAEHVETW